MAKLRNVCGQPTYKDHRTTSVLSCTKGVSERLVLLRSVFKSSCCKMCSRSWGFEFLHAYIHFLRKMLVYYGLTAFGHGIWDPRFEI